MDSVYLSNGDNS